jgi:hypothetical protein
VIVGHLLHEAGWYGEADVAPGLRFAALAVPGYLTLPQVSSAGSACASQYGMASSRKVAAARAISARPASRSRVISARRRPVLHGLHRI